MHESVFTWLCHTAAPHAGDTHVIELGSANINGTARHAWPAHTPWTGIDLHPAPGVDITATSHHVPLDDNTTNTVVCVEMLEHDPAPQTTFAEIRRILRPGGTLILTTRAHGFPHHHPPDHWRYTDHDLEHLCTADLSDIDWRPAEQLDPPPPTATTPADTPPPLTVHTLQPDTQPGHPGWFLIATR